MLVDVGEGVGGGSIASIRSNTISWRRPGVHLPKEDGGPEEGRDAWLTTATNGGRMGWDLVDWG